MARINRSQGRQSQPDGWDGASPKVPPVLVRLGAIAALAALAVMSLAEFQELRGETAFARLCRFRQVWEKANSAAVAESAVASVSREADWVMLFGRGNPDALRELAVMCRECFQNAGLDPKVRLRMGEKSVAAALLAVRAAPSDYETWLLLACAQASLGLRGQSALCLRRARELGPPGMTLKDPLETQ